MLRKLSLGRFAATSLLVIIVCVCVQASMAMVTAYYSIDDGKAINYAGSLRMRAYQMASIANSEPEQLPHKLDQFELVLHSLKGSIEHQPYLPDEVLQRYAEVESRWAVVRQRIATKAIVSTALEIRPFVGRIDRFVKALEEHARFKLMILMSSQIIGVLLLCMFTLVVMSFVRRHITYPLAKLEQGAEQMAQGEFEVTVPNSIFRELTTFGQTLGGAAAELDGLYRQLAQKVEAQDVALQRAHKNLSFLYETSMMLQGQTQLDLDHCLELFQNHSGATSVTLLRDEGTKLSWHVGGMEKPNQQIDLPLQNGVGGRLLLHSNEPIDSEFLHSFALMITQQLQVLEDSKRREQVGLMEERAVIARELHDSLGQLLAYMKIQMSLLKRALTNGDQAKIAAATTELQQTNDAAYQQLRELLTTFRLKLEAADLEQAIISMIRQLQPRTEAEISLNYQMPKVTLEANRQVHLLQLLQEAVVNAIKHAQANEIHIKATVVGKHWQLIVSDNGVGMTVTDNSVAHFGLGIMKERAYTMGAELTIGSNDDGGVSVTVMIEGEENVEHG